VESDQVNVIALSVLRDFQ
jgi:hypothetical protein